MAVTESGLNVRQSLSFFDRLKRIAGVDSHSEKKQQDTTFSQARKINQATFVQSSVEGPQESWSMYGHGDYAEPESSIFEKDSAGEGLTEQQLQEAFPDKNGAHLKGEELILASFIQDALQKKKKIRLVDVGGMIGMSWMKLGTYFREEVIAGNVELIVTNLKFDPAPLIEQIKSAFEKPDVTEPFRQYYQRLLTGFPLVKYVNASTDDLSKVVGTADLIFEKRSATYHSAVPAEERSKMLEALNPEGVLISHDHLSPLRPSRYDEIWKASGGNGLKPRFFEGGIDAARENELTQQKEDVKNSPEYAVVDQLTILKKPVRGLKNYTVMRKSKLPVSLLS